MTGPKTPTFSNHSKRNLGEDECRSLLNAAMLVLVKRAGGRLEFNTAEMLAVANSQGTHAGVALALSDDDSTMLVVSAEALAGIYK